MSNSNTHITILPRSGQTQEGRVNENLLPRNIKIDDRTISDFILFAKKYSQYIKYYDQQNSENGNWEAFWNKDISAILANLSGFPINDFYSFYWDLKRHMINLIDDNNIPDPIKKTALKKHLRLLFQLPILLLNELSLTYSRLNAQPDYKDLIAQLFNKDILEALKKIIGYYKGAIIQIPGVPSFDLISISSTAFPDAIENIYLPDLIIELLDNNSLFVNDNPLFGYNQDWSTLYNSISANENPFIEGNILNEIIYDALHYNLFNTSFENVLDAQVTVVKLFEGKLEESLTNFDEHSPHFALWLTFIKLLTYQQKNINEIPSRHLDYYYKEVLNQCLLKPTPNRTHILFELNKNVEQHLIEKGTLLNAGKDKLNKKVNYQVLDDIVINQTKVSSLKSIYLPNSQFPVAAPFANSLDGIEALTTEEPSWKAFYDKIDHNENLKARLGFAIADPSLFLKEGTRTITFAKGNTSFRNNIDAGDIDVYYTSEKGWEKATLRITKLWRVFVLKVVITADQDACVHFDKSIHIDEDHQDDFNVSSPVVKLVCKNKYYNWLKVLYRNLTVSVRVDKVKDILVSNKNGIADTSKSFPLFGSIPDKLPSFMIGSSEVFSKNLSVLKLNLNWQEAYTTSGFYTSNNDEDFDVRCEYLKNGSWLGEQAFISNKYSIFENSQQKNTIDFSSVLGSKNLNAEQVIENQPYSSKSKDGFIRIHVDRDFGHRQHPLKLQEELIFKANNTSHVITLKEPFSATINELSLEYSTISERPKNVFELQPFGFREAEDQMSVVPSIIEKGQLYIGLEKLQPLQKLNLLFQIKQGTANPLAEEADIRWSYLKDNTWSDYDFDVEDSTNELNSSGIISFSIPKEINQNNTILPSDLHWFRLSIRQHTDAINNLLSIDAQACLVEFRDQNNDPKFYNSQLPPQTISKLEISDSSVKKLEQKYSTFGGSALENSDRFYTRVSERLRHKDRAIQLWDYEHLVLENFLNIYRLKCLNHTKVDNHNMPGHITLIPLPKLESFSSEPLKPYSDKKTRLDIHKFIKDRISPFICLHVVQTKLESIQIDCDVKFNESIDDMVFYKDRLRQEIIKFLTPWAYEQGQDLNFEGKWYKANIINFIDERPYVSYIKNVKMYHHLDAENETAGQNLLNVEVVLPSTARSVLVSSINHIIRAIDQGPDNTNNTNCKCNSEII